MTTVRIDRRTTSLHTAAHPAPPQRHDLVRQGVRLQASLGTISAVEYLKANGIASAIIVRVLSDGRARGDDRA